MHFRDKKTQYELLQKISPNCNWLVWGAFFLILAELLILLVANPVFYRDSAEYLAVTDAFRLSHWEIAFPQHLPVLYTVFAGLLTKLHVPTASALLFVSGFFTALTVFPLFGLLKKMVPEKWAAWGCILFALFPDIIHCGCAPLIDSGRFFFMTAALYLVFSFPEDKIAWSKLFLLGLTYGGLALVRAEGICLVAMVTLLHGIILYRSYRQKKTGKLRFTTRAMLILLIPLLLALACCSPRMYQMQQTTGYPCLDERQVAPMQKLFSPIFNKGEPSRTPFSFPPTTFSKKRYWDSFFSGLNYLYLPFTLLGILVLIYRKKMTFHHWLVLLLTFLYSALHYGLKASAGRYFLINMIFLLPFTITGFYIFAAVIQRKKEFLLKIVACAAIIIAGIEIVRSLQNLRGKNGADFRYAVTFFKSGGPLENTNHSKNQHPTVLFIGDDDYGLGYYAQVNTVIYSNYPIGLASEKTIEDILKNGVEKKHIRHWHEQVVPEKVYFDVIAVRKKTLPAFVSSEYELQKQSCANLKRLQIYKIVAKQQNNPHDSGEK